MSKKQMYKQANKEWLEKISREEDVHHLPGGVCYRILKAGNGDIHPTANSVIMAHYTGKTIDGKVFDSSRNGMPLAVRLRELIAGWVIAMMNMTVGDRWEIYIPSDLGYGKDNQPGIPAHSTLIFDIELLEIA